MKTKQTKRPACKPVKAWAVASKSGKILPMTAHKQRYLAEEWLEVAGDFLVRVEIREIRRTKR